MSQPYKKMCERCGQDEATTADKFCRDCDIEWCAAMSMCRECKQTIWNPEFFGPTSEQHGKECSLKDSDDYTAPNEIEQWALWDGEQKRLVGPGR